MPSDVVVDGSGPDTSVAYMGLRLAHPFVAGASPLSARLDTVRQLEDAGAAAIVLHSLFEEQIAEAQSGRIAEMDPADPQFSALLLSFPAPRDYPLTPDRYLEHITAVKAAVAIPVIASLNGASAGVWLKWGQQMESAGADALEVNFYEVVADLNLPGIALETHIRDAVIDLKKSLHIPISVKLSPFFTAFGNMARRLDDAGVDALVMFNRFYQHDIDIHAMQEKSSIELSTSAELLLRLRWLAVLAGRVRASLAVTGGIATADDGVKAILAGAHVVQSASGLLRHGPMFLDTLRVGLVSWMREHDVRSLEAMRGRVSLKSAADPAGFERAAYLQALNSTTKRSR